MDENNKGTEKLIPLQDVMVEIFGDNLTQRTKGNGKLKSSNMCNIDDLPEGVTVNFNPTINVVSANSDSSDNKQNNPSLSEVGKFASGIAAMLSMFLK